MKYDVCVFGGCSLDQTFYQNPDGTYNDQANIKMPGGKGANQAVAAARAGAKVAIISRVGKDEIGRNILDNLTFNMVNTTNVEVVEGLNNDSCNIYINIKDKDNDIERVSGAIESFTEDMVYKYADVLLDSNIIVCQLKVPKEVTKTLINFCYEHNKKLILTPCRPERLSIEDPENIALIDKIFIITANRKECQTMFGTDDVEKCVRKYPNKLIVTLGKDGIMYFNGKRIIKMPAIDIEEVIDTTGAGDTLNGNLACFLAHGMDLQQALRKAMYASTMKLMVKTAQQGMPYADELNEFISTHRNKKFEYFKELDFALKIIKQSYYNVRSNSNFQVFEKEDNSYVTGIDIAIEDFLITKIRREFKDDNFVTEERNPSNRLQDRTWIIDPIDGTSHFIKSLPFWGIQLAFYDKGETKFSVIYLPKQDELYYAAKNMGAYVNNNKILELPDISAKNSVVEFGGSLYKSFYEKVLYLNKLLKDDKKGLKVLNILQINSCCNSFTNLVSGRTNALIIASNKPWDVMPGMLLCKEAGVKSYSLDFKNIPLKLYTTSSEVASILLDN